MLFKVRMDDELELALLVPKYVQQNYAIIAAEQDYLNQWLNWPKDTKSYDDLNKFAVQSIKEFAESKSMTCSIIYKGVAVGAGGFNSITPSLKKALIGYWLGSQFQGKGIMTRVVKFLIQYGFDELGLEKIETAHALGNEPSQKIIKAAGFIQEGTIKNAENLHGKIVDHVVYGICK